MLIIHLGQFTVPSISGQYFPPTSSTVIEKISNNKGIIFGGRVTCNGDVSTATNSMYIFSVTHSMIVSFILCTLLVKACGSRELL